MQHAVLVIKQLVLLHGIPSDVKVSSVIDESQSEECQKEQVAMGARAVPWKIDSGVSSHIWKPRDASFDSSSSRREALIVASAPQVRPIKTHFLWKSVVCFPFESSHSNFETSNQHRILQNTFTDLTEIVPKFGFAT